MLRTTISRIRKVCALAFVPRVLRDDICNVPASYAGLRKAHKSTKSTDDGPGHTEKGPKILIPNQKKTLDYTTGIPITHRERCQKIIDQAFGPRPTDPDKIISEQYCSHTVNIENTRKEIQDAENAKLKLQEQNITVTNPIVPDDRQYGIFKMSRELIKDDDNEEEILIEEDTTKKATSTEPDLVSNMASMRAPSLILEDAKKTPDDPAALKECAKDHQDLNISNPETPEPISKQTVLIDDTKGKTINLDKKERSPDLFRKIDSDSKQSLNVTTVKEDDEKLAQKLETIEETPLVEAQRPGIEGLNVNPRVLGDKSNPTLSTNSIDKTQANFPVSSLPPTLDDVAKRCLNGPIGQLDEMLLNEMEKVGISLTCDSNNKTPSSLMGDELVQMENLQRNPEIFSKTAESEDNLDECGMRGSCSTHHMFSGVKLPDLNEQSEEVTLLKPKDIEPTEKDSIPNPDKIKKVTKPVSCEDKPTTKVHYRVSELDLDEMERDSIISPPLDMNMHRSIQQDIELKHKLGLPKFDNVKPNIIVRPPAPHMQALHSSVFKQITERFRNAVSENRAPHSAEAVKPTLNPANVSRLNSVSNAAGNIGSDGLFKPEYSTYLQGVRRPSHYGTINASDLAGKDQQTLVERETENKNSIYSRYLASSYAWSQAKEAPAAKFRHKNEIYDELGKVDCHGRTPELQPKLIEDQAILDEKRNAANRLVDKIQFTKLNLPGNEYNKKIEHSLKDKVVKPHQNIVQTVDNSEYKINLQPSKCSLSEELLKEHELDPYYVLTCNETCPISPGPSLSTCKNTDFVDTTDTIYMKKNICESIRPKPIAENMITPFEDVIAGTQTHQNGNVKELKQPKLDVKSLMTQYESLTSDTQAQLNEKTCINEDVDNFVRPKIDTKKLIQYYEKAAHSDIDVKEVIKIKNLSESVQPKADVAQMVKPECDTEPANTQAELDALEWTPELIPEIHEPKIKPSVVSPKPQCPPNSKPKSNQVSLNELLRRVREKSHPRFSADLRVKVDPTTGKCNRRAPRCNPVGPRSPPLNPVPLPSFGLPMVKRRPEVCKPRKKGGGCSKKCAACDIDVACGVQGEICPEIACELNEAEACVSIARVDLSDVVMDHIQTWGKIMGGVLRQVRSNFETLLARDYEPWSPIPSWPIPKKPVNPYENWMPGKSGVPPCVRGCPVFPKARASMNPEPFCAPRPCKGFPKRRSFSALDCFAVSLGENKVYDLGQF